MTTKEEAPGAALAKEIVLYGWKLLDAHGKDIPNIRTIHGINCEYEREPMSSYLRLYRGSGFEVKHTGPGESDRGWSHCFFVFQHRSLLVRMIDTIPASLECDPEAAQKALMELREVAIRLELEARPSPVDDRGTRLQ